MKNKKLIFIARNPDLVLLSILFVSAAILASHANKDDILKTVKTSSESTGRKAEKVMKSDKEWREILTPEEFRVMREKGTERAGTGKYVDNHESGSYKCAACGQTLFNSEDKFDSGTGWPSYTSPVETDAVREKTDTTFGMKRTEVLCSRCDSHLGHVFDDGPEPTGRRYCINSVALDFSKEKGKSENIKLETAIFGAGCFWCVEAAFQTIEGVKEVSSGYMGGHVKKPTYKEVSSGQSGHAEVTEVLYDPSTVSYSELLAIFWKIHDPTSLNKQGADIGSQYRSAIFYHSEEQKQKAEKAKKEIAEKYNKPIVTEISPASEFYKAENYHQDYYKNNPDAPYCKIVIKPKLKKLGK